MRYHRLLPHTADTRLEITADSLEELFKGAVEGMSEIIKRGVTQRTSDTSIVTHVEVASGDITTLLVDFLNDLLVRDVIEKAVFFDVTELEIREMKALASVRGINVEFFDEDVKAVTYYGAQIQLRKDGTYEVELVLDI